MQPVPFSILYKEALNHFRRSPSSIFLGLQRVQCLYLGSQLFFISSIFFESAST